MTFNRDYIQRYWMFTKCDPDYNNNSIVLLCLIPGLDNKIESRIPITLMSNRKHFSNKFCAICNLYDIANNIIYWEMEIFADNFVAFPHREFVEKSNRGNVFFLPPEIAKVIDKC